MLSVTGQFIHSAGRARVVQPWELHAASAAIDAAASELCAGLIEAQLSWSPGPGKWSIIQNLAHLRTTTEVFLPGVDDALAASSKRNLRSEGPYTLSLYGRVIVWHLEGPTLKSRPFIRLKAPEAIWPSTLQSPAVELQSFLASQAALRQRMEAAAGLHLTALRFPSPLVSYFRVNLLEFFSAVNAHSRRHLRQGLRLRQALSQN